MAALDRQKADEPTLLGVPGLSFGLPLFLPVLVPPTPDLLLAGPAHRPGAGAEVRQASEAAPDADLDLPSHSSQPSFVVLVLVLLLEMAFE
jgi:hypothetical protein